MRSLLFALIFTGTAFAADTARPSAPPFAKVQMDMRLIPFEPDMELQPKSAGIRIQKTQWTTYSDEVLSFDHPTDPSLKLVVQKPGDRIPIEGDAVTSAENSFFRAYRLTKGDKTQFLLMLDRRPDFDDGICLCGAIAFEKYAMHNGALFRFSYLYGGRVKKVQALNNEYRAECFEWTHMPIPQDDYFRIAQSVRFKVPESAPQKRREAVFASRGFKAKLGFLERGTTRDAIVALLGQPVSEDDKGMNYSHEPYKLLREHIRVPLRRGRFHGFDKESFRDERIPAARGTLDWMRETLNPENPFGSGPEKPLAKADVKLMFDRFVELAPKASPEDWSWLCQYIYSLHGRGHDDPRIAPILKERFCDMTLNQNQAGCYLADIDRVASQDLFLRRAKLTLEMTRNMPKTKSLTCGPHDDLHNLLVYLSNDSPERLAIIREGLAHPHPAIRNDALYFHEALPEGEALPHLRRAISNEYRWDRRTAAAAFAENRGTAGDLPLLRKQLAEEKEKDIREKLIEAVSRLEKTTSSPRNDPEKPAPAPK